jgi:two-component system sensor histidine kinase RegB
VNDEALEVVPQEGLTEDPADRWLVWLRWVAVLGMAATVVAASLVVEELDVVPLMSLLFAIGASNLVWYVAVTGAARRGRPADAPPRRFVELQLGVDVVSLGLMFWFAGGIENPFVVYLVFQIALAGLLCTPRATLLIALLTVVVAAALALAPPLPAVPSGLLRTATWVSIASLATLLAVFVAVYARRLSQLRSEGARNEKLAVLGRLVGMMSHELNTPLATISLLAEELHQFHSNLTPAELDEMLGGIAREAKRAHEIVGLVRGHVASDQSPEAVDVGVFVQEHAHAELARLGFGGKVSFDLEPGLVAQVLPRALLQVLVNVLKNATEASLLTRGKVIEVGVRRRGRRVEVLVEDRGPGFTPEVLARVGEPFSTTKEGTGGMGMGLFISALLANRMGAKLSVATRATGGARVVLSLPIEAGRRERDSRPRVPSEGEGENPVQAP